MNTDGDHVKTIYRVLTAIITVVLAVVAIVMLCTNRKMERYDLKDSDFMEVTSVQFATPVDSWQGKLSYFSSPVDFPKIEVAITGEVVTVRIHYKTAMAKDYSTHITGINQITIYM